MDDQGQRHLMIEEIEDHRKNSDAVPKEKGTIITPSGLERKKKTTKGWELFVRWKGGSGDSERVLPCPTSRLCCSK